MLGILFIGNSYCIIRYKWCVTTIGILMKYVACITIFTCRRHCPYKMRHFYSSESIINFYFTSCKISRRNLITAMNSKYLFASFHKNTVSVLLRMTCADFNSYKRGSLYVTWHSSPFWNHLTRTLTKPKGNINKISARKKEGKQKRK
jgi:hypothetical protein